MVPPLHRKSLTQVIEGMHPEDVHPDASYIRAKGKSEDTARGDQKQSKPTAHIRLDELPDGQLPDRTCDHQPITLEFTNACASGYLVWVFYLAFPAYLQHVLPLPSQPSESVRLPTPTLSAALGPAVATPSRQWAQGPKLALFAGSIFDCGGRAP